MDSFYFEKRKEIKRIHVNFILFYATKYHVHSFCGSTQNYYKL